MTPKRSIRLDPGEPPALQGQARDGLCSVREATERAGSLTALPGRGLALLGTMARVAAVVASLQPVPERWVAPRIVEAPAVIGIAAGTTPREARRAGDPMAASPGRKLVLGFAPPVRAAALPTPMLLAAGLAEPLPALRLAGRGATVVTGGTFSVQPVPLLGGGFMVPGVAALVAG